ncbi:MAG: single-stranded DNA-binding protein [Lactobacillales bacterium]|jgi:single-strand DNA-binding protein|nr:single-stranded DNA-binding protein [Lactobacillales bacterium]
MINNVVLVGRLTRDPELRYTNSNVANVTFTLAVNRNFTNQQGQREADFINVVIWRKSAEVLAQYAKKGTLLGVTGRIQTRNYENQQGQRVYVTEVVADNFQLLESRKTSEQRMSNQSFDNEQGSQVNSFPSSFEQANKNSSLSGFSNNEASANPFGEASIDISDDDLPF